MDSGGEDQCPHVAQFIHIIIGGGGVPTLTLRLKMPSPDTQDVENQFCTFTDVSSRASITLSGSCRSLWPLALCIRLPPVTK